MGKLDGAARGDSRGRKREKERRDAVGRLGSTSPWWDAVGKIMETNAQALVDRRVRFRSAWPAWPQWS